MHPLYRVWIRWDGAIDETASPPKEVIENQRPLGKATVCYFRETMSKTKAFQMILHDAMIS